MNWRVPYVDLAAQYRSLKPEIDYTMQRVMDSGRYIGGEEVERFEAEMAKYLGVKYVISCGNGYDAIFMALTVLGAHDDWVSCDSYTHVSTHSAIAAVRARKIEEIANYQIVVHMNGRVNTTFLAPPDCMIEDACQAIGASYKGKKAGTFGVMGCFSLHPMKVLGVAGDGGFISTNSPILDDELRHLRNHGGGKGYGVNSRLDSLQAAIAHIKLKHLDRWINERRVIASLYEEELPEWVKKPPAPTKVDWFDVYSSYVIGGSPELLAHMRGKGIECFSHIRTDVVSLPIYPEMTDAQISAVIEAVKSYANG